MYVTMKSEAYGGFMIKAYLDDFDKVTFGKTKNRAMISRIVWLRDYVLSYMEEHGVYTDVHEQPQITTIINNNYVTDDNYKTWFTPNEKMIQGYSGQPDKVAVMGMPVAIPLKVRVIL